MSKTTIFLADDHAILREGLKHIIDKENCYEIIGESGDGREALEFIEKLQPHIAILDISMPSMTGIEVTRQIKKFNPHIKIIILSQYDIDEYVQQLLKYKIDGYILKDNAGTDLLTALSEVIKGNVFLSAQITKKIVSSFSSDKNNSEPSLFSPFMLLSPREIEILKLIAEGYSNAAIASALFISEKTVKNHRANVMNKLNLHKTIDLVKYALKNNLIES